MANANDRLVALKKTREERIYNEAVLAAGFDNSVDYDAWLTLEELRKPTLAERKAIADKENPPKYASGGIVTISGSLGGFTDYRHQLSRCDTFGL